MKLRLVAILMMGLLPLGVVAQSPPPGAPPNARPGGFPNMRPPSAEMPEKGKLSYAIGVYFGNNITNSIKRGELTVNNSIVLQAISDVVNGNPVKMNETEVRAVLDQLRAAMSSRMRKEEEEAKAKGEEFLAQFAKSPDVKVLPDGLEYKVIKSGTGPVPKESDSVTVNYRGTLIDGKEFDRHDGFTTQLRGGIIQGWQKILALMNVGSEWQVVIPSTLGYGPRGRPPKIPGNSVLIFDMELKSIMPGTPTLPPIAPGPAGAKMAPTTSSTPVVSGQIIKVPSADELKKGAKIEVINSGETNNVSK